MSTNLKTKGDPDSITIAFAGKRILPDGTTEIRSALDSFFEMLLENSSYSEITMLNGLAEGSDQFAAEQFISLHSDLHKKLVAVVPMAIEDFRKTIENESSVLVFDELLNRADETIILSTSDGETDENAPFIIQSNHLVNNADILLAVADLSAEVKDGGTLDTIQKFLRLGKPVYCFDFVTLRWNISNEYIPANDLGELTSLENLFFLNMKQKDIDYYKAISTVNENNIPDRYMKRLRFWTHDRFEKLIKKGIENKYKEFKLSTDHPATTLEEVRVKYDQIAYHYSKMYRGGYLLNYFGFAIAVTIAASALGLLYYRDLFFSEEKIWQMAIVLIGLGALKLLVIIGIIRNTENLKRQNINRKHVDFRYVAERLRIDVAYAILGHRTHIKPKLGAHLTSLVSTNTGSKLYQKIARDELSNFKVASNNTTEARQYLIEDQLNFHSDRGNRHRSIEHKLERWSEFMNVGVKWLVIFDILIAALYLLCHFCNWHSGLVHFIHESAGFLIFITIALPAFVAALVGITAQSEYDKIAIRNERLETELKVSNRILKAKFTQGEFDKAAQKMMDEITEWTLIYEKKVYEM